MSSPRPSWRPLLAGTLGLFLVIFAFLAGQLRSGGDPALGKSAAAQRTTEGGSGAPQRFGPGQTQPYGTDPSGPQTDGFVPGGSAAAPPVPDGSSSSSSSSSAPTTHQS
jgi:hypothetical protein